jgi:hypothetical protein
MSAAAYSSPTNLAFSESPKLSGGDEKLTIALLDQLPSSLSVHRTSASRATTKGAAKSGLHP